MWFKVDDSFHSHPKAMETSLAAIGLWALAGSWSGKHQTDGFVSDQAVTQLSRGAVELAKELAAAGLWKRCKGGYRFHEWDQRNPSRSDTDRIADRKASGGALGNHLRWHAKSGKQNPDCQFCQGKDASEDRSVCDRSTDQSSDRIPNPDPTRPEGSTTYSSRSDPEGFAEFWDSYPFKRGGRTAAAKAYRTAIRRATPQAIQAGVQAYRDRCAQERTEERFVAHAATWLNQSRWDEFSEKKAAPAQRAKFAWEN